MGLLYKTEHNKTPIKFLTAIISNVSLAGCFIRVFQFTNDCTNDQLFNKVSQLQSLLRSEM